MSFAEKIVEIREILEDLGYEVVRVRGPFDQDGDLIDDEADFDDSNPDSRLLYFLIANAGPAQFYIRFDTGAKYAQMTYQMNIIRYVSRQLEEDEVELLLDINPVWDDIDPSEHEAHFSNAIRKIIENSDPIEFNKASYYLFAYSTTALVEHVQERTEDGFPTTFECTRTLFPYTENMTLQHVDDRLLQLLIAGNRGHRYVREAFIIDKTSDNPTEYNFMFPI